MMARLIDLGDEEEVEPEARASGNAADEADSRLNPNVGRFSAALTCYPWVLQVFMHSGFKKFCWRVLAADALTTIASSRSLQATWT